jgi:hypothetical protein
MTSQPYTFAEQGLQLGVSNMTRGRVDFDDPSTWTEECGWEQDEEGMIGLPPFWTKCSMHNRQNEKLYQLASTILGSPEVIVSIDRFALFRPMAVKKGDERPSYMDEWETCRNVHLDMNPWALFCSDEDEHVFQKQDATYSWEGDFMQELNAVRPLPLSMGRNKIQVGFDVFVRQVNVRFR